MWKYRITRGARIRCVTWGCPRCGRPFLTEQQMLLHYLSCK